MANFMVQKEKITHFDDFEQSYQSSLFWASRNPRNGQHHPQPMPCLGTVKYQEDPVTEQPQSTAPSNAPAVCVIGGGPSGLGCCRRLCDAGMRVTLIQESRGGMEWVWVRWGRGGAQKNHKKQIQELLRTMLSSDLMYAVLDIFRQCSSLLEARNFYGVLA